MDEQRKNAGQWVVTKRTRKLKDGKPVGGWTNHDVYRSASYEQAFRMLDNMPPDTAHECFIISSDRSSQRIK